MRLKGLCVVLVSVLVFGIYQQMQPATIAAQADQAATSTKDGVYTAAQADQGKVIYKKECAGCHGDMLQGKGKNVPLVGDVFLNKWTDQTLADLFMKTNTSMPASNPGTMAPGDTAKVLAYIFSANKFQAGQKELPTDPDALQAISIKKP